MEISILDIILLVWTVAASAFAHQQYNNSKQVSWLLAKVLEEEDVRNQMVAAHAKFTARMNREAP